MSPNPTQETHHHHHAIFLPLPLQGHINPSIQLALTLASSRNNFTITFLLLEDIHHELTKARGPARPQDIFEGSRAGPDPVDIRVRVVPDGLPLEFDRKGRLEEYLEWYLYGGMYGILEEAVGEIVRDSNPRPNVLVADTFFPWGSKIAKKWGLKYASFWTEMAVVFSLYYHMPLLRENGHFDCPDTRKDPIEYIPGVNSIDPKDLPSYLQDKDASTNMHKILFAAFQDAKFVDYVLCNTADDFEPETISALRAVMPFYAIGPIIHQGSAQRIGPTSLWVESSCSEWLDSKPNGSILYVSFGSLASFTRKDVMEIAYGLVLSNVGFIWVLRPRTTLHDDNDDLLPPRFEDEINGRGIIVPWTDQINVLSHRAIGGFLTHCGWNSVLESIWYEVPMLCYPVFTDQFTNRRLVVGDWKVGIDLIDEKPITREDIAAKIKNFMSSNVRDELCKHVKEVRKVFKKALDEHNGSLKNNLDLFIDNLEK